MKKVLFAITNLEIGGAEKVLVNLVNQLKNKYQITVLTLYGSGCLEKKVDKEIKVESIFKCSYEKMSFIKRKICALQIKVPFLRKRLYKRYVAHQYDVEIAFLEGPITDLLQEKSPSKKIAWIHTDLLAHYPESKYKKLLKTYNHYENLVFVSKNSLEKFETIAKDNYQGKKQIIYNYIDFDAIKLAGKDKMKESFSNHPNFVVVARLVPAKGIERLMKVHKDLLAKGYLHHIYVIGEGPLKEVLLNLQKEYGIIDTFHFLGKKMNPYPYIVKGDYFLLPSLYEGYPVTLMEAMALNQYIIATNIASAEVLEDYPNKLIVENTEEGIYEGLKGLILKKKSPSKKKYTMSQNGKILEEICHLIEEE